MREFLEQLKWFRLTIQALLIDIEKDLKAGVDYDNERVLKILDHSRTVSIEKIINDWEGLFSNTSINFNDIHIVKVGKSVVNECLMNVRTFLQDCFTVDYTKLTHSLEKNLNRIVREIIDIKDLIKFFIKDYEDAIRIYLSNGIDESVISL